MVEDNRDGQVVVEVALESLLRQWDELAGWLADNAKTSKRRQLERTAAAWQNYRHNPAWLMPGTRLPEAQTLAARPDFFARLQPAHVSSLQPSPKTSASEPKNNTEKPNYAAPRNSPATPWSAAKRPRRTRWCSGARACCARSWLPPRSWRSSRSSAWFGDSSRHLARQANWKPPHNASHQTRSPSSTVTVPVASAGHPGGAGRIRTLAQHTRDARSLPR